MVCVMGIESTSVAFCGTHLKLPKFEPGGHLSSFHFQTRQLLLGRKPPQRYLN